MLEGLTNGMRENLTNPPYHYHAKLYTKFHFDLSYVTTQLFDQNYLSLIYVFKLKKADLLKKVILDKTNF